MAWADLVESANAAFLATWGVSATLTPRDGSGSLEITGIIKRPDMDEDVVPGSEAGTSVVRFWVDFSHLSRQPQIGDTVGINTVSYDVGKIDVDIEGGAVLRLRKAA